MRRLDFRVLGVARFLCVTAAVTVAWTSGLGAAEPPAPPPVAKPVPKFFQFLPDDFEVLISFNSQSFRKAEAYSVLRKNVEEGLTEFSRQLRKEFGVEVNDVSRFVMAFRHKEIDDGVIVMETTRPQAWSNLLKRKPQAAEGKDSEVHERSPRKIGQYTMYAPKDKNALAICLPDDRTMVCGRQATLEKVLVGGRKALPDALRPILEKKDYAEVLIVVVDTRDADRAETLTLDPDKQCQFIDTQARVAATIDVTMALHYRDAKQAEQSQSVVQFLTLLRGDSPEVGPLFTVLSGAKHEVRDNVLTVVVSATPEQFNRIFTSLKSDKKPEAKPPAP